MRLEQLSWVSVFTTLTVGIAARDCVLVATSLFLALHVARAELNARENVDLLRGAIHCWLVGAASLLVTLVLLAMVIGVRNSLWEGNHLDMSLLLLAVGLSSMSASASVTAFTTGHTDWPRAVSIAGSMIAIAFVARSYGDGGPCLFAIGIGGFVACTGWRLARTVGTELARSAVRI